MDITTQADEIIRTPLGEYCIAELRELAGAWHGGQFTALYAFASTGTITDGLAAEARGAIHHCDDDIETDQLRAIASLEDRLAPGDEDASETRHFEARTREQERRDTSGYRDEFGNEFADVIYDDDE